MSKESKASEILRKFEDKNEHHFHDVDRKWIIEAMEEYAEFSSNAIHNLFNKPAKVLEVLHDQYRKENPMTNSRFYIPDRTKFYEWIVKKIKIEQF